MSWAMYIDDERVPKITTVEWVIVRSVEEAKDLILKNGCPAYISFDHDLGDQVPTGFDLAKWMVECDLDQVFSIPADFQFNVHSANPTGAENIRGILNGYLKFRATNK